MTRDMNLEPSDFTFLYVANLSFSGFGFVFYLVTVLLLALRPETLKQTSH